MGNRIVTKFGKSKSLTDEEIVEIQKISKLSSEEIREEHKGFLKLQPTGKMTKEQFIHMYKLLDFDCDMTDEVACEFDFSGDGYLDHEEITAIFDGAVALGVVKDADHGYAKKTASEVFAILGLNDDSKINKEQLIKGRSSTIVPIIRTSCNTIKTNIESNHRICFKLILAALIPLMIGIFTIVTTVIQHKISVQQRQQDKQESNLFREQSERHADNLQKETILVKYLDDISNLLMLDNQSKIFAQIRTKTLTTLRQLDAERKKSILLFLCESELICRNPQYLNSSLVKLNDADFNGIQLDGTDDNKCSFTRLKLYDAYLSNSSFIDCYIDYSDFSHTTMNKVVFFKRVLIRTSFKFASLNEAKFCNMKLSTINFIGASLIRSDFTGTVWDNTTVDFTNANLTDAKLSDKQLKNSTLDNCILPNGTWGPIRTKNLVANGDITQFCGSDDGRNLSDWKIPNGGEINVFPNNDQYIPKDLYKCYFRVVKLNNISKAEFITQTINLEHYSRLITSNMARYKSSITIQCFGKEFITFTLRFSDSDGLRYAAVDKEPDKGTYVQTLELSDIIRTDVSAVQILVTFINSKGNMNTSFEGNDCRCYNVYFSITKA
ncbi:unnamed protein product [Adineta steineri]|uniref:EF-hand domain-containing protein n=2 Tax=Adineta steineri TaxID=433720 RepID=A0A815CM61_9BILA|nr:unnamed protein product [Adineta steineri]CAF3829339.1 unnamed protein product [Adineta steineri]